MQPHILAITGSSGNLYHIEVAFLDDGRVTVNCSCTGGLMGTFCKHREAIVCGDDSFVVNEHRPTYAKVYEAFEPTDLDAAYHKYLRELAAIETEKKALAARTTRLKKDFATMLREGI